LGLSTGRSPEQVTQFIREYMPLSVGWARKVMMLMDEIGCLYEIRVYDCMNLCYTVRSFLQFIRMGGSLDRSLSPVRRLSDPLCLTKASASSLTKASASSLNITIIIHRFSET
jgi:hypothetical protein